MGWLPLRGETPDIRGIARDFVIWAGANGAGERLDPSRVFFGRQPRASLPPGPEEYAVLTLVSAEPHGRSHERYDAGAETLTASAHWLATIQVDFCGGGIDPPSAFERASAIRAVAGTETGTRFFKERGANVIGATGLNDLSAPVDADEPVQRFRTTLTAEYGTAVEVKEYREDEPAYGAERIKTSRVENVDAHHPPKE
jgi:hypothetical protein